MRDYQEDRRRLYHQLKCLAAGSLSIEEQRQLDRELVVRGLARQDEEHGPTITQKGRQFLFHMDCEDALQQLFQFKEAPSDQQVLQWLLAERFVLAPMHAGAQWEVTARGRGWLESLAPLPCGSRAG